MTEEANSITQPIAVNQAKITQPDNEGTKPIRVAPSKSAAPLPDWLIKFASGTAPITEEPQNPDSSEEEANFIPPAPFEDNTWNALDHSPAPEPHLADAAETSTADAHPSALVMEAQEARTPFAEEFRSNLQNLFTQGEFQQAVSLIRQNQTNPVAVEIARKTLRSQLTLSSATEGLWDVYDELNSISN